MDRHEMTAEEAARHAPEGSPPSPDAVTQLATLAETHRQKQNDRKATRRSQSAAGAAKQGGGEKVALSPSISVATSLRRADLHELLATRAEHRVSLYMSLRAPGAEGPQNPIRLTNLLREAQSQLVLRGLRPADARVMLKPAQALVTNAAFWRQGEGGLSLLIAPQVLRCYRLPGAVEEQVHVSRRFVVRPLLALLDGSHRYWLLSISQNSVRLFRGDAEGIAPVEVEGLPSDMAAALNLDMSFLGGQVHSATNTQLGRQAGVFHGQGGEADTHKEELKEYFRAIDAALRETLQAEHVPLLVASVDYQFALYREVNTYPQLVARPLPGNVEHLGLKELHAQAWPLVEPHLDEARREATARYARLLASGKATPHIAEILPAAREGRIETLFVLRGATVWGVHDVETNATEVHAEEQPGDDDLLELAAVETLARHGTVYPISPEELRGGGSVGAILRF